MKPFHIIVLGVFLALALVSVFIFATYSSIQRDAVGDVSIWGPYPSQLFEALIASTGEGTSAFDGVRYRQVPEDRLIESLVEAIASGSGPDLVMFPSAYVVGDGGKLVTIPYASVPRRYFDDSFIEAGEAFLGEEGALGLPFVADPLIMYWNRSLFASAGIAQPPMYWDELIAVAPKLTKSEKNGTLTQSAVALGTWDNVNHAKDIFVALAHQLGNPLIIRGPEGYVSTLDGIQRSPIDSALIFYTDFADPVKTVYSWNRSQPDSRSAFLAGKLAMYLGYASELQAIRAANPNLNFDIAPIPNVRGSGTQTISRVIALSIPRGSRNPEGALTVAQAFTSQNSQGAIFSTLYLPSVRRDSIAVHPEDPYGAVLARAALSSFSFLDPDPEESDQILQRMIESISSGRLQTFEATYEAHEEMEAVLSKVQ